MYFSLDSNQNNHKQIIGNLPRDSEPSVQIWKWRMVLCTNNGAKKVCFCAFAWSRPFKQHSASSFIDIA